MKRFDRELQHTTSWKNWDRNPVYKVAVRYEGQRYPAKQIVALATGLPTASITSEAARECLQAHQFDVFVLSAEALSSVRPGATASSTAARPRDTITQMPTRPAVVSPTPTTFNSYVHHFQQALSEEIKTLRTNGGQKTFLTDGRYLGRRDDRYVYSFAADTELRFPDDTPVDIEYQGRKHPGWLVSVAGFDLILALKTHLGETILTAVLFTSPWFLLEELKERLSAACVTSDANQELAITLLHQQLYPATPDHISTQAALRAIAPRAIRPPRLNTDQLEAVARVQGQSVTYIWGPPGTGKTWTLGLTVAALVERGETVLVVAHSNAAVDVAMMNVADMLRGATLYTQGQVLRYGGAKPLDLEKYPELHVRGMARRSNPELVEQIETRERQLDTLIKQSRKGGEIDPLLHRQIDQVKQELEPLKAELQAKELELVRAATVVGCTLSKSTIAPEIYNRQFDAVIIDEASMAYIPHCAFVATRASQRVAVFGDFRQLAPIA